MRKFKYLLLIISALGMPLANGAEPTSESMFGRYVGTLKHDRLNVEQLAKIDFVVSRSSENQLQMKAVLTLHFGDFKTGEYVSHHFDSVSYDLLSGSLVFDQANEGVTIISTRFANGELVAELHSNALGKIGELKLKAGNVTAAPKLPLLEPVAGDYRTTCKGKNSILQLHTMRSVEDSSRIGNPFGSYDIRGQFGHFRDDNCTYDERACQRSEIKHGAYNYFTGELEIIGYLDTWSCKTDPQGFKCNDGCTYKRVSSETRSRVFAPPQAAPAFASTATNEPIDGGSLSFGGTYNGYLHHEYLDHYQPAQLSIVTYQNSDNGERRLKISASARIFFGAQNSSEAITYRFEPRDFPNPLLSSQFVLERLADDVDAFLKINSIKNGVIRGEWHSLLFGRVGTFELRKPEAGIVVLPEKTKVLAPVTGTYDEPNIWQLKIKSFLTRTPPNSENPYFPLDIAGSVLMKSNILERREDITGGSYDFYTGKFALRWRNDAWIIGWRTSNDEMVLHTVSNVFGSIIQDYQKPKVFRSIGNVGR